VFEWLRVRSWWRWLVLAAVVLFALDLALMLTGGGSIDPTDPSNLSS
jgi:hypothetical protein